MEGRGIIHNARISAVRILTKQGGIYAAQGKKTEALAKYNEALQDAPEDMRKSIQTAIEKLK